MTYPIIAAEPNGVPKVMVGDSDSIVLTPSQPMVDVGMQNDPILRPHFPGHFLRAGENDLTYIAPGRPQAEGEVISVSGQVLDDDGRPVRHTCVELWNANRHGRYTHEHCPAKTGPIDPNFHGCGRTVTDESGRYVFRTIRPGPYLAEPDINWWRPAHLHFSIFGGGTRLITQMLFPGDDLIKQDLVWLFVDDERRRKRMIAMGDIETGNYTFDIILRGPLQSPMDDSGHHG